MTDEKHWYVLQDGNEVGPLTSAQLKTLAREGTVTPETSVRLGSTGAWVFASKVKRLFDQSPTDQQQERFNLLERDFKKLHQQYQWLEDRYKKETVQWHERVRQLEGNAEVSRQRRDEEIRLRNDIWRLRCDSEVLKLEQEELQKSLQKAKSDYSASKSIYDRLRHELNLLEENVEDISFGLYNPHFEFDTSEMYRRELESVRNQRKLMARQETAVRFEVEWLISNSRAKGMQMQKQLSKLMLRAFNGETEAAIANCRWNNISRMEERVRRSHLAINRLGTVMQVKIVDDYLALALQELQLEFEYQEKKRAETEEQREIRDRMKEEDRAQRELERAEAETAAEETRYSKALLKAKEEVELAHGQMTTEQLLRIQELERQLAEAHSRHERAVSMAQLTRCGYVYIISNVGSFGENMYKIGLTRRLDPNDRVRELGDASVPFAFDVHAMVYSDDAPLLENALHREFREHRVNLINFRKEFFHISLEEVQAFVVKRGLNIKLTKLAEAREYRESLAIRAKAQAVEPAEIGSKSIFPAQLEFVGEN